MAQHIRHGKNVDPVITQLTVGTYFSQRQRIFDSVRHTCSIISFTTFFLPATKEHYGQWGMYNSKEWIWEICVPCRICLNLSILYMFRIHALRNIYSYVLNKCTFIKYAFITYLYSPTCFSHLGYFMWILIKHNNCPNCISKTTLCYCEYFKHSL